MKNTKKNSVKVEEKAPFAQRHPGTNFMIGLALLVILVFAIILFIWFIFSCLGKGIEYLDDFLKKFVSNTDKVIIVAMITGMVSIISVVFTSVIAIDYRYNVKNTYMIKERHRMNNL